MQRPSSGLGPDAIVCPIPIALHAELRAATVAQEDVERRLVLQCRDQRDGVGATDGTRRRGRLIRHGRSPLWGSSQHSVRPFDGANEVLPQERTLAVFCVESTMNPRWQAERRIFTPRIVIDGASLLA